MNLKTRFVICWMMTAAVAVTASSTVMSNSPNASHRVWMAASVAFMVLFNGWLWSMLRRKVQSA